MNLATAGGLVSANASTRQARTAEEELDSAYSAAIRDIADQLVHELAPLVGAARLHAAQELADVPESKTIRDLDRIRAVLRAVDELARASCAPVIQDLNIADIVSGAVETVRNGRTAQIQLAGADPFPATGDPALLTIVLRNGLANAVEATESLPKAQRKPIVVSWGRSGRDYRISVLDRGPGLPAKIETLLDLGVSTKGPDHPGLGLTLAYRAALSLDGKLSIRNADDTGVSFEFRWPRQE